MKVASILFHIISLDDARYKFCVEHLKLESDELCQIQTRFWISGNFADATSSVLEDNDWMIGSPADASIHWQNQGLPNSRANSSNLFSWFCTDFSQGTVASNRAVSRVLESWNENWKDPKSWFRWEKNVGSLGPTSQKVHIVRNSISLAGLGFLSKFLVTSCDVDGQMVQEEWHCSEFFSALAAIVGVGFISKPETLRPGSTYFNL